MDSRTPGPLDALDQVDALISGEGDEVRRERLTVMRSKLVANVLGDVQRVSRVLTADFENVVHIAGVGTTVSARPEFLAQFTKSADRGASTWCVFDHLLANGDTIMADGRLLTSSADDLLSASVMQVAIVVEFSDGLMSREIVYLDPAAAASCSLDTPLDVAQYRRRADEVPLPSINES